MLQLLLILLCVLCNFDNSNGFTDNKVRKFPGDFKFGVATSAYQVEGAWDEDGKGLSIWDTFLHEHSEVIADGRNGDEASDSYHQYKRDVEMLRELGVDVYRFSISWSRIMPTGFPNKINKKGIEYYNNLINELVKYNIIPMITLYHFDLPQPLQDLGGWANPYSADWFEDYARVVFNAFADRVQYWITINQPNSICLEGYGDTIMAPAVGAKGIADYMCVKHVLVAHAKVYRLYKNEYKDKYKGSVGISLALNWIDPVNNTNAEDKEAAERARDFHIHLYTDPIWSSTGDFPPRVKQAVAARSKEEGLRRSRLPVFTPEEIQLVKGSADFIGMNHYTTFLATPAATPQNNSYSYPEALVVLSQGEKWPRAASVWLGSAPYGIYRVLIHLNLRYDYPKVFITENGWSTKPGFSARDEPRVESMRNYLKAILLAMEDGAQVQGYCVWSLMDNVEWVAGTSERFGLYEVDFSSANKTRSARLSALAYKHVIQSRIVDETYRPDSLDTRVTGVGRTEL